MISSSRLLFSRFTTINSTNLITVRHVKFSTILNLKLQSNKMSQKAQKKVALIHAKFSRGQGKPGTELGPNYLKNKFLVSNLENLNHPAVDYADLEEDVPAHEEVHYNHNRNLLSTSRINQKLSKAVQNAISEGHVPVLLGGDHSLAIGSVHGTANAFSQIGLIWVDAHADMNTPLTSSSGNLHGQPLSFLLYELDKYLPKLEQFDWLRPCLSARNLVYIGLRDLDPEETILIEKYKIKAFSMSDVHRLGIHQVMKETFEHLTVNGELLPLHVSVDIDSLDPWYAPATGTPVLGGLSLPELMFIGNRVHETGKLRTLDLVEVNPLLKTSDSDVDKTVFSASRAILSFFGYKTLGTLIDGHQVPRP
ncbi:unnamed protein product [Brachionus calyciflorus]|uniref:Arginase n=1 Tax=Brachionus calyciflorus TaxID=104777 RepID=A0A813LYB1_9BILA|nr:unnamed protein product [Brachionus calyciflorus]